MHSRLVILNLILLLTDGVVSTVQVSGVVGQPATLPCSYAVSGGDITSMCWGRGECPVFKCADEIVWTDGSRVTFQKHERYTLRGYLLKGNVSLTIENATEADSGLYCCRVEHRGWFNDMKLVLSLEMKPATLPSPAQPSETQPTTLQERRSQPSSSPFYSHTTDGNGTVTQSSDGLWHNNQTQLSPTQKPWTTTTTTNKGLYIGISLFAVMLLALLVVIITKKCFYNKNKMAQLSMVSLNDSKIGALQNAAERRVPPEDNIYIIDDNVYVMD
ncbi:hepatitis A virus cellular receptor 1 isoform X2 [Nycticebus coucang]|uniref:hepatitis A virus cellular receptor 1 isoform X2 n=1 Tax=Nycticebus coucang TaxID=9470 RepID=UPI00234CB771|nr:hepatitis A virus cellular receptor 1 isoform X2 [Nycticebus coucang]